MKIQALIFASISSISMLSANQYGSCPGGNCAYPAQGQNYYQGNYNQSRNNQYQNNYQDQNQYNNQNTQMNNRNSQYNNQNHDGYYNQNSQMNSQNRNSQYNNQNQNGYYNQNSQMNSQNKNYQNSPYSYQNSQMNGNSQMEEQNGDSNEKEITFGNRANNSKYLNENGKSTMTAEDLDIEKSIRDEVASHWYTSGYPNVTFDVNNGNVNLSGTVKSEDDKAKLESDVRKIKFVKQVNSQVTVDPNKSK